MAISRFGTYMDVNGMRNALSEFRTFADARAMELKDSQSVVLELMKLYKSLDNTERLLANHIIAEWVVSEDEKLRFDALALIDEFRIRESAKPLRELVERLTLEETPAAPYELKKVNMILDRLREEA